MCLHILLTSSVLQIILSNNCRCPLIFVMLVFDSFFITVHLTTLKKIRIYQNLNQSTTFFNSFLSYFVTVLLLMCPCDNVLICLFLWYLLVLKNNETYPVKLLPLIGNMRNNTSFLCITLPLWSFLGSSIPSCLQNTLYDHVVSDIKVTWAPSSDK